MICDAAETADLEALDASVRKSSLDMRERIAFAGRALPSQAIADARHVNSERLVLCCPAAASGQSGEADAIFPAAAMAGRVLAQNDPSYNWNGESVSVLSDCVKLAEEDIQSLIAAGVTVFEDREGVRCVRAVTTKTLSGGAADLSMRPLGAILTIDEVISSIRRSLEARLSGVRLSHESIASQIVVQLSAHLDEGLLSGFDSPVVYASGEDPSVCVAELGFQIAHALSQIHISAHIKL